MTVDYSKHFHSRSSNAVKYHVRQDNNGTHVGAELDSPSSGLGKLRHRAGQGAFDSIDQLICRRETRIFGADEPDLHEIALRELLIGQPHRPLALDSCWLRLRARRSLPRRLTSAIAWSAGSRLPASAPAIARPTAFRSQSSFAASSRIRRRTPSRTTSLACAYSPDATFASMYASSSSGSETFLVPMLPSLAALAFFANDLLCRPLFSELGTRRGAVRRCSRP